LSRVLIGTDKALTLPEGLPVEPDLLDFEGDG
jgi:hypothetical protein